MSTRRGAGSPAAGGAGAAQLFAVPSSIATRAWESGIELLENTEVDDLSPQDRNDYLRRLHSWQFDQDITDGPYQAYRRWQKLCKAVVDELTGKLCLRPQWEHSPHCLDHSSIDEIDPKGAEERRKKAQRARLAALADAALDYAEDVIADVEHEKYAPSVRAKVAMDVLDRVPNTSKKHEAHVDVSGEVTHTVEAREIIDARLERMAEVVRLPAHSVNEEIEPAEPAGELGAGAADDV